LVLAPGIVAFLIPWWLTDWQIGEPLPYWAPVRVVGAVLIAVGLVVLLQAFARFVTEGIGTPAPVAPPQRLVVGGLYRYVRNPMYLAVLAVITGQALALGQPSLLLYAAVVALAFIGFVRGYEEPNLRERFGPTYDRYRRAVPGWWPRLGPWDQPADEE
jgi:protein-S-isoprenylcysteine O-methyltransferase Ste14